MGIEAFDLLVHFDSTDVTTLKNVTSEDSVSDIITQLIHERQHAALPPNTEIVLAFRGKQLDDLKATLGDLGISKEHTLDAKLVNTGIGSS